MLTRRHFILTTTSLFSAPIAAPAFATEDTGLVTPEVAPEVDPEVSEVRAPISDRKMWSTWDARVTPADYNPATSNPWGIHQRFLPVSVEAKDGLTPGDIHVDAVARYLYHIQQDGTAMRYGVAIARGNLYEPGTYTIRRKQKWPTWRPTDAMIEREPEKYSEFADGVDGGPTNPLGSRALYLFTGNRDTYLRIHGTPQSRSIGGRASSGCVRMIMAHIIDLYGQVAIGSTAYLYPPEDGGVAHS